ncbi:dapper homolog 1-like [Oncorhynchus clarkii lewisi]|uniref:dapper homolog 1-like n=1 Tax=Oncorhynchus clarkii lewisi TaxID=490388 RepID=UPI0039B9AE18
MDTMKETAAVAEMLVSKDCTLQFRERRPLDKRSREKIEAEMDRVRTRERFEATLAGLGELEYLRQRQELLVRNVLNHQEYSIPTVDLMCVTHEGNYLNSEEKLLEENILLLRKQLNCLRRRDAGLINQLQELDRQISDLRLDTEVSREHVETDSRPSSGFYELSDGASGSLSNSSNSVFSECLSNCRSSTCFCSPLDTSLCASEGRLKSADELGNCAECEGQCEEQQMSGTVRRSPSAPYSPSTDTSTQDIQSKYHCDLIAKNGSDVYRYPSPLHAVAVQNPIFLQSLSEHLKEDGGLSKSGGCIEGSSDCQKLEQQPILVPQSTPWSASHSPANKRLDNYIFSLLQRRAQPIRTNKPRTSISTDPSKSILRQGSLCVRQASVGQQQPQGLWTAPVTDLKPTWQTCLHAGGASNNDPGTGSQQRQWSVESKGELLLEIGMVSQSLGQPQNGYATINSSDIHTNSLVTNTNSLLKKKAPTNKGLPSSTGPLSKDYQDLGAPNANSSPKERTQSYFPNAQEENITKLSQTLPRDLTKTGAPKKSPKSIAVSVYTARHTKEKRPMLELVSLGSSSQSQDESQGHMVSAQYIPAQRQVVKLRKGGKNVKIVKVKSASLKPHRGAHAHAEPVSSEMTGTRENGHRSGGSRKSRQPEEVQHVHKVSSKRGASSRAKRTVPASIPEGRVLEKHMAMVSTTRSTVTRHHGYHGREVVVAKPKYKRTSGQDYNRGRLRAITEVPYDEALRRAHRRQKRELLGQVSTTTTMYLPSNAQFTSPYAYVAGSDSEYSAECASLFHSTIMDTSEDERSNYTTNCFGDSESSLSEVDFVAESTISSDSEESGGMNWPQFAGQGAGPQEVTTAQAKAFVKIKASHNLKKKILRFRSAGSLKLMTTV